MKLTFYGAVAVVVLLAVYFQIFGQSVIETVNGRPTPYKAGGLFDSSVYYNYDSGSETLGAIAQRKVDGVNKEQFEVIDIKVEFNDAVPGTTAIGKTKDGFYHEGKKIPFDPLDGKLVRIQRGKKSVHFYQTQDKVYFQDGESYSEALGADPKTLIPSPDEKERQNFIRKGGYRDYYQDENKVYYMKVDRMILVQGANPSTFQIVTGNPEVDAIDRNQRYFQGELVP